MFQHRPLKTAPVNNSSTLFVTHKVIFEAERRLICKRKQRMKFLPSINQLILAKPAARDNVLQFTKDQQSGDIKTAWLKSSDGHFLRGTTEREVGVAVKQHELAVAEKRDRLVSRSPRLVSYVCGCSPACWNLQASRCARGRRAAAAAGDGNEEGDDH